MKTSQFYEFTKGHTANFLKEARNLSFEAFSDFRLTEIKDVTIDKIDIVSGHAILTQGNEQFLMFSYKRYFYTSWYGAKQFPAYHPVNCPITENYSGFVFANKMPVDIYSRDENGKVYKNKYLDLCKKCSRVLFETMWGSNQPWYESVLKYIENDHHTAMQANGYHPMWSQVSAAYREKIGWRCEDTRCRIDLSRPDDRHFLHTHHLDEIKSNNKTSNFKALCILCHALEHEKRLRERNGFEQVDEFVEKHRSALNEEKLARYFRVKAER